MMLITKQVQLVIGTEQTLEVRHYHFFFSDW